MGNREITSKAGSEFPFSNIGSKYWDTCPWSFFVLKTYIISTCNDQFPVGFRSSYIIIPLENVSVHQIVHTMLISDHYNIYSTTTGSNNK